MQSNTSDGRYFSCRIIHMSDSLYRISLKCIIKNQAGEILLIKEAGRSLWDFPGGGMEHGESIQEAIARELKEEISLEGPFTSTFVNLKDPAKLRTRDIWQVIAVLAVIPEQITFSVGTDSDAVKFMSIESIKSSLGKFENVVVEYVGSLQA